MEYTKGKWYVSLNGKVLVKDGEQHKLICDMPFGSAREADAMPEANANAHLIAASPAMYEALKAMYLSWVVRPNDDVNMTIYNLAKQALSQAEGK